MPRTRWAADHPNWIGDDATYSAVHRRLASWLGAARDRPCVQCGCPADNWAYDHQDPDERVSADGLPYSTSAAHYRPMCLSCHGYFDADAKGQARCGTDSGYYRHRRRGQPTCPTCRDAHNAATYARQRRRGVLTEYEATNV